MRSILLFHVSHFLHFAGIFDNLVCNFTPTKHTGKLLYTFLIRQLMNMRYGCIVLNRFFNQNALYSIIQMPPGIPVATVAINGAMNAAILAVQMLALSDESLAETFVAYKEGLKKKIVKANEELKEVKYEYKID